MIDGVIPTVSSYAVTAGTKSITLNMTEAVTGSPLVGDFTVSVNTVAKTVTAVGVGAAKAADNTATTILLTMGEAIPNDATVTVAYTQNASNLITGVSGGNSVASVSTPQSVSVTNDNVRPTITEVSGVDGTYDDGDTVAITVTFSEVVVVTGGNARITLETGSTDGKAIYASGSGTANLLFNYTVGAGEASSDLGYVATSSLSYIPYNASIKDNAGNLAILDLPTPGNSNANSLAHNDAIIIQ